MKVMIHAEIFMIAHVNNLMSSLH